MTSTSGQRLDASQVTEVLKSLASVLTASVVMDDAGEISEIHVISSGLRPPKQVVRDVESALLAKFGLSVDHRKVGVVELSEGSEPPRTGRVKFAGSSVKISSNRAEASVKLEYDNASFIGTREGAATSNNLRRMAAQATLDAVAEFVGRRAGFSVREIVPFTVAGRRAVMVIVDVAYRDGRAEQLVGAAYVEVSEDSAIARAALDSLNRRLPLI